MENKNNNDKSQNKNGKSYNHNEKSQNHNEKSQKSQQSLQKINKQKNSQYSLSPKKQKGQNRSQNQSVSKQKRSKQKIKNIVTTLPIIIDELDQSNLNLYMKNFMQINDFQAINKGKILIDLIKQNPLSQQCQWVINKSLKLFKSNIPVAVLCSFQFLRELIQIAHYKITHQLDQLLIMSFVNIIQYRKHIKTIDRGNTYFAAQFYRYISDDKINHLIKLSSTFFRMVHQTLYVWGTFYFPQSRFAKILNKMQNITTFPQFPQQFKFYSEARIKLFKTLQKKNNLTLKIQEQKYFQRQAQEQLRKQRRNNASQQKHKRNNSNQKLKQRMLDQPKKQQFFIQTSKQIENQVIISNQKKQIVQKNVSTQAITNEQYNKNKINVFQRQKLNKQQKSQIKSSYKLIQQRKRIKPQKINKKIQIKDKINSSSFIQSNKNSNQTQTNKIPYNNNKMPQNNNDNIPQTNNKISFYNTQDALQMIQLVQVVSLNDIKQQNTLNTQKQRKDQKKEISQIPLTTKPSKQMLKLNLKDVKKNFPINSQIDKDFNLKFDQQSIQPSSDFVDLSSNRYQSNNAPKQNKLQESNGPTFRPYNQKNNQNLMKNQNQQNSKGQIMPLNNNQNDSQSKRNQSIEQAYQFESSQRQRFTYQITNQSNEGTSSRQVRTFEDKNKLGKTINQEIMKDFIRKEFQILKKQLIQTMKTQLIITQANKNKKNSFSKQFLEFRQPISTQILYQQQNKYYQIRQQKQSSKKVYQQLQDFQFIQKRNKNSRKQRNYKLQKVRQLKKIQILLKKQKDMKKQNIQTQNSKIQKQNKIINTIQYGTNTLQYGINTIQQRINTNQHIISTNEYGKNKELKAKLQNSNHNYLQKDSQHNIVSNRLSASRKNNFFTTPEQKSIKSYINSSNYVQSSVRRKSSSKLSQRRSSLDQILIQKMNKNQLNSQSLITQLYGQKNTLLHQMALNSIQKRRKSTIFC